MTPLNESPVNVGAELVPAGVMLSVPPVVPTLEFATKVPSGILPLSSVASVYPDGQEPDAIITIAPDGNGSPPPLVFTASVQTQF